MTPYEAWTGNKPQVSHFQIFGCTAYAHIPADERRKLDFKSKRCVMLGYGKPEVKGYRLYDLGKLRVFFSRDVVFNELTPGSISSKEGDVQQYVEIDGERDVSSDEKSFDESSVPTVQEAPELR